MHGVIHVEIVDSVRFGLPSERGQSMTAPLPLDFECLWRAADVARYLNCSRSLVYQKAESGLMPSLRVGGMRRFDPEEIRRWVRAEQSGTLVIPIR